MRAWTLLGRLRAHSWAPRPLRTQRRLLGTDNAHHYTEDSKEGEPAAPSWVLCTSLAEAHAIVSITVDAHLRRTDATKRGLQQMTLFMALLQRQLTYSLHVPRDVRLIEDLPMFLAESTRSGDSALAARFSQLSEADILDEFEEWVLSSLPSTELPSALDAHKLHGTGSLAAAVAETDTMPFLRLMGFVQSYTRYHTGVIWGAAKPTSSAAVAAYHRRAYRLHPWHGVDCPEGWAAQMPYVHVMQWMTGGSVDAKSKEESEDVKGRVGDAAQLFKAHRATELFSPASLYHAVGDSGRPFSALDVCCQSGHGVDLLLKAGATRVLAVDAAAPALGNTQATVHEHRRERRSAQLDGAGPGGRPGQREVVVRRCPLLPSTAEASTSEAANPRSVYPNSSSAGVTISTAAAAASVFASAAARRRQCARGEGRVYTPESAAAANRRRKEQLAFDVLYYHPPTPPVWPLTALACSPQAASVWWRLVARALRVRGAGGIAPLPFVLSPSAAAEGSHPHQCFSALDAFTVALRSDGAAAESASASAQSLVAEGGYVVCVLPRSYEPVADMTRSASSTSDSLSDYVVTQLDDCYRVVLRRRHRMDTGGTRDIAASIAVLRHLALQRAGKSSASAIAEEANAFLRKDWWVDVLVMRRQQSHRGSLASSSPVGEGSTATHTHWPLALPPPVEWEDSFEYNEYKPRSGGGTRYHWTDLVPTYSYLEPDYFEGGSEAAAKVNHNFLAVGHPPTLRRDAAATGPVKPTEHAAAADKFKSVFAQELRHQRRTKLRKMALAPIEQQEWYIDEKLIKSEAAKVEFVNELSRWDFKDYDK